VTDESAFDALGWTDPDRRDDALYRLCKRLGAETLPPGFADDYVPEPPTPQAPLVIAPCEAFDLTKREIEVLLLIAAGATNDEIGKAVYVYAPEVVRTIFRKMKARNRAHAVHLAWRGGLLRL
jgi:DNA-binding CsgD family transcriptional regulator